MRRATKDYGARPRAFALERNDCSVRALAVASGRGYAAAHAHLAAFSRTSGDGVQLSVMRGAAASWAGETIDLSPLCKNAGFRTLWPTLAEFIRRHRRGAYVLLRRGHFFALVNGTLHDWPRGTGARTRIRAAIRMPEVAP